MAKAKNENIFVSVVLIASDDSEETARDINDLSRVLKRRYTNYEIICVSDRPLFVSSKMIKRMLDTLPCIRIIQLSHKDSIDVKIFAGVDSAIGDSVVTMLAGKDPVNILPDFVSLNKSFSIIFGISESRTRRGAVEEYGSRLFYWYNKKFLGINIPNRSTYYAAFDRAAVNALTRTGRYARHIRYLARQIGYENTTIEYLPKADYTNKRGIKELVISALELSTNYSNHPLRSLGWLGFAVASINIVYAMYVLMVGIFKNDVAEGWVTTSLQLSVMFFFLFAAIAILSEYIGTILQETRNEQPYHVINELNSKVSIADVTKRNIERG